MNNARKLLIMYPECATLTAVARQVLIDLGLFASFENDEKYLLTETAEKLKEDSKYL